MNTTTLATLARDALGPNKASSSLGNVKFHVILLASLLHPCNEEICNFLNFLNEIIYRQTWPEKKEILFSIVYT